MLRYKSFNVSLYGYDCFDVVNGPRLYRLRGTYSMFTVSGMVLIVDMVKGFHVFVEKVQQLLISNERCHGGGANIFF